MKQDSTQSIKCKMFWLELILDCRFSLWISLTFTLNMSIIVKVFKSPHLSFKFPTVTQFIVIVNIRKRRKKKRKIGQSIDEEGFIILC